MQNPSSFKPTGTYTYKSYTSDNYDIEHLTNGITFATTLAPEYTYFRMNPSNYKTGQSNSYTLTFSPKNYLTNMYAVLKIPASMIGTQSP